MGFWERTWQERQQEVGRWFGRTDPPGVVTAFSWKDIRLPGACGLSFPPVLHPKGDEQLRQHWLYLTLGLTQPLNEEQMRKERAAGKKYSSHGYELGILTKEKASWPTEALYLFLTHITEGVAIKWGERFAFGFHGTENGSFGVFTGEPTEPRLEAIGEIRAVLFWPYLSPCRTFLTSTGNAMIMIATGITADEWELAKASTTAHVLLLLCRSGVGQLTDFNRHSVLKNPKWREEWQRIAGMDGGEASAEVEAWRKR